MEAPYYMVIITRHGKRPSRPKAKCPPILGYIVDAEEAVLSMPPYTPWLRGRESMGSWLHGRGSVCRGSKLVPAAACGSTAFGRYHRSRPNALGAPAVGNVRRNVSPPTPPFSIPELCFRSLACLPGYRTEGPFASTSHLGRFLRISRFSKSVNFFRRDR